MAITLAPELSDIRDRLIAELPNTKYNATKYEGAIQDAAQRGEKDLAKIESDVRAKVNAASDQAISFLAQELKRPEYQGKTPEQIQQMLMQEVEVFVDVPEKSGMQEIVEGVLSEMIAKPADLAVFADGTVETANTEAAKEISQRIAKAVMESGNTEEDLQRPRTRAVFSHRVPPPISRIWQGIPYAYNTPPVEVIQRALEM